MILNSSTFISAGHVLHSVSGGRVSSDAVREYPNRHVRPVPDAEDALHPACATARPYHCDSLVALAALTCAVVLRERNVLLISYASHTRKDMHNS